MTKIRFVFDFISPYSYLAWHAVQDLADRRGLQLEPVPVLLAALLDHWGHLGPAEIPPKRDWVIRDIARRAHDLGLPISIPPTHPFHPVLGLRLANLDQGTPAQRDRITQLFAAVWQPGGKGVESAEAVAHVFGAEAPDLLERAGHPENKQLLIQASKQAVAQGIFGVPTMMVGEELFWGLDSLGDLERWLDGNDPVDRELLEQWRRVRSSSTRTR